jgi:hypothetical protein
VRFVKRRVRTVSFVTFVSFCGGGLIDSPFRSFEQKVTEGTKAQGSSAGATFVEHRVRTVSFVTFVCFCGKGPIGSPLRLLPEMGMQGEGIKVPSLWVAF